MSVYDWHPFCVRSCVHELVYLLNYVYKNVYRYESIKIAPTEVRAISLNKENPYVYPTTESKYWQ